MTNLVERPMMVCSAIRSARSRPVKSPRLKITNVAGMYKSFDNLANGCCDSHWCVLLRVDVHAGKTARVTKNTKKIQVAGPLTSFHTSVVGPARLTLFSASISLSLLAFVVGNGDWLNGKSDVPHGDSSSTSSDMSWTDS